MNEGKAPAAASPAAPASPVRLANLNTFNPKTSLHFSDTYVFRGSAPQQRPFGELFVVLQIDHGTRTSPQVADAIATILQHEYYRGNPSESAKNFEDALHKTNEILSDLAARGEIHWIGKLHGLIAVVQRDTIHVSATGRGKAFLVRGNDIADIAEGLYDAGRPASPMKTFEHLASGELKDGDVVLLATPGISELIVPQQLRQMLRSSTPDDAAGEIQARVGRDPAAANSGIVIRYDRRTAPAVQQAPVRPAVRPAPQKATKSSPAPVVAAPAPAARTTGFGSKLKASLATFKQRRARAAAPAPLEVPDEKASPSAPATEPAPKKARLAGFSTAIRTAWRRLPKRARTYGVLALALIVIFVISLVAFTSSLRGQTSQREVADKLAQAQQLEEQIVAAVIFKDFGQAQQLMDQARALVATLPTDGPTKDQVAALQAALAADQDKLTGSVKVGSPKVLASLEGKGQPRGIALVAGKLVVWTESGNVEIVPTNGGDVAAAESIEAALGSPTSGVTDESRAVVLTSRGELVAIDGGKIDELDVGGTFKPAQSAALATFGNRLYVLDGPGDKITRHSRTVAGYSQGDSWILDDTSVRNAVDLAVDGDLWLLRANGQVTKLTQGSAAEFKLGTPSQPLTSPTRLVTGETDTFLYILESSSKRLLQFDKKSGDFVKQYTSDQFGDLAGVVVNEKANVAYLLSGTQVVQIDLQS